MRVPTTELHELLGAEPSAHPASAVAGVVPPVSPTPPSPDALPTPTSVVLVPPALTAQLPSADPSAGVPPVAPPKAPSAPREGPADIRFELARALPSLWGKARKDAALDKDVREKDKLRELIVWLLAKRQATVRQRVTLRYQQDGKPASGRLDVVAHLTDRSELAIEVDWAYAAASLAKLQAAQRQGMRVMWVCGAPLTFSAAKALRARANAEFGPTYGWLFMFHLDHGWL